jgi:UDP-glucose 4-epimerase
MINNLKIKKIFKGKTILITGGTGSFGSTMLKKIISQDCRIKIFSRDELKQDIMRSKIKNKNVDFIIGDVRDKDSVDSAMRGVDIVFHAAALKQVPSCEFFPEQAIATNIIGSNIVFNSAIKNNVSKVVALSTDKSVLPINAMGMSKSLMEKTLLSKARNKKNKTIFSIVRYGNVIYSRGSVIPLFSRQIIDGKDITITNPEMTRFLITLDDAISLVFLALDKGMGGDIFIKKSAASTIDQLAKCIKELFNSDQKIKIIGTRHGEKIYETLATKQELSFCENNKDYYRIKLDSRDLNYDDYFKKGKYQIIEEDYTSHNTKRLSDTELKKILVNIPELQNIFIK